MTSTPDEGHTRPDEDPHDVVDAEVDFDRVSVSRVRDADVTQQQGTDEAVKPAREAHPSPDIPAAAMNGGVNSPAFLTGLVKWHPAVGSFQYLADCFFPADMPAHLRFGNLAERHRRLLWTCIIIDLIVMIAVLLGLAWIAARVIWVTLQA